MSQDPEFKPFEDALLAANPAAYGLETFDIRRPGTEVGYRITKYSVRGRKHRTHVEAHKNAAGVWVKDRPEGLIPPFGCYKIKNYQTIAVFPDMESVKEFYKTDIPGVGAICPVLGTETVDCTDWAGTLKDVKDIVICPPDNAAGYQFERYMTQALDEALPGQQIRLANPDNIDRFPPGGTFINYISTLQREDYETVEQYNHRRAVTVKQVLQDAGKAAAASALEQHVDRVIAGEVKTYHFPNTPILSRMTQALAPGTLTVVCAAAGTYKSMWLIQLIWMLFESVPKVKVKVLMLESTPQFHQGRAAAQMTAYNALTNTDKIFADPTTAKAKVASIKDRVRAFERDAMFVVPPPKDKVGEDDVARFTYDEVVQWAEDAARLGYKVLAIDPVTMASGSGDKSWKEDDKLIARLNRVAITHGIAIILSTHPKAGQKNLATLEGMAGGQAFARFTDTVFWIVKEDEAKTSVVWNEDEDDWEEAEHTLRFVIRKSRAAEGNNMEIALAFDRDTFCLTELGLIKKKGTAKERAKEFSSKLPTGPANTAPAIPKAMASSPEFAADTVPLTGKRPEIEVFEMDCPFG